MKPGATMRPAASSVVTSRLIFLSTRATTPSSMRTSSFASSSCDGSTTRPPAMSKLLTEMRSSEEIKDGHAHGNAVRDLLQNHRPLRVVGHVGSDLHAAVHRAGMHDDGVGPGAAEALRRQAEGVVV